MPAPTPVPPSPRSFSLTFSTTDLKDLDAFLQSRSYLVKFSASAADAALFTAIGKEPDAAKFPNVARYYKHIGSMSAEARKALPAFIGGVSAGGAAAAAPAPTKKAADDEDVDLFGDDADAKPVPVAEKPKAEVKKVKEKPVARSICVYEVKPMSVETNPKDMEAAIRSIEMDGLRWSETFEVIEVGFGIKKIMVQMVIEDDKVDLTDLEERMVSFKGTTVDEETGEIEDLIQSVDQ
jgi:elongation factor 1-beta